MDKRFILTMVLCFGVYILWVMVLQPLIMPPRKPAPPAPPATSQPAPGDPTVKPAPKIDQAARLDPITLTTDRFVATFNNRGAVLDKLVLKHDKDDILLIEPGGEMRPSSFYMLGTTDTSHPFSQNWHLVDKIKKDGKEVGVQFRTRVGDLEYDKIFLLVKGEKDEGRHVFRVEIRVKNLSEQEQTAQFQMFAFNGIRRDSDYRYDSYLQGFWSYQEATPKWYDWASTHKQATQESGRVANGLKNRYFALVLMPDNPARVNQYWAQGLGDAELKETGGFKNIKLKLEASPVPVPKGSQTDYVFDVYAGPIRTQELAEAPRPITKLQDFTGFDFVCSAILGILSFFASIFGGPWKYGIAIVFTTLFVRLCLFYLNKKSQTSMFKMSQLAPKMEALKLKYKDNPEKLGQEQWKLFREEKVSPLSGCLPMLLQFPIFIAMYSVLEMAVDLRHQPFLWFDDLSQPDRLINFGNKIFWDIESFNLLPLVMTVIWVIQAMMAPKSKDPQMQMNQKMMQWMPLLFGFMCYNLAAGLSWYFLINALLGIVETKIIKKYYLPKTPPETTAGSTAKI